MLSCNNSISGFTPSLQFFNPISCSRSQGVESNSNFTLIPGSCTATSLLALVSSAAAAPEVVTFRHGTAVGALSDTALTCTVGTGSTSCSSSGSVSVGAGSLVDVSVNLQGPGNTPSPHQIYLAVLCQ